MAIKVTRSMINKDAYSWTATGGDDDARNVKHDAVMFNRKEGYEVQRMIQNICNDLNLQSEEDVKRVENAIANDLPGSVRSQKNVRAWLNDFLKA